MLRPTKPVPGPQRRGFLAATGEAQLDGTTFETLLILRYCLLTVTDVAYCGNYCLTSAQRHFSPYNSPNIDSYGFLWIPMGSDGFL
jgi:hypothetical protein